MNATGAPTCRRTTLTVTVIDSSMNMIGDRIMNATGELYVVQDVCEGELLLEVVETEQANRVAGLVAEQIVVDDPDGP